MNNNFEEILKKLETQKTESLNRIDELKKTDPFNLDSQVEKSNELISADDEAQVNEVHERVSSQVTTLEGLLVRIDSAIERINDGTYGVCEVCGKEIDQTRLSIMPLASMCLADEKSIEKRAKAKIQ
jgi:RNA polymerase-binding transcription factor DksA